MSDVAVPELEGFAELASLVKGRIFQKILYELQTGGGISLENLAGSSNSVKELRLLEQIRGTLSRMRALSASAPARFAAQFSRPNLHVLDIGAGKAPWSLAIASLDPSITVTGVDLPDQMSALQSAVSAAGLSHQFTWNACDIFGPAWTTERKYDLVVIANVCHLFDERRNKKLLRRAAQCLRAEGTLVIIDQLLDNHPDWARWSALYLFGALHCAPGGRLFPMDTYAHWLSQIGSWEITSEPLCPLPPITLIVARCCGVH
jgi:ubiquinone/menaquinone biosynthesis C-methylase UbiE